METSAWLVINDKPKGQINDLSAGNEQDHGLAILACDKS